MSSKINIILATDDRFAAFAATVILSVLQAADQDEEFEFCIISTGLSDLNLGKFSKLAKSADCKIRIVSLDNDKLMQLPETNFTKNTYLRMFAPELLPEWDKAVYLDCDLLVCGSLKPLFENLQDDVAAVVVQDHSTLFCLDVVQSEVPDNFPLDQYFNAGVMGLNLRFFRDHNITSRIEEILSDETFAYKNQTSMNIALKKQCFFLPLGYNVTPRSLDFFVYSWSNRSDICNWGDVKIVHYTGRDKPWKKWVFGYGAREFRRLTRLTPWGRDGLSRLEISDFWQFVAREFIYLKFAVSLLIRLAKKRVAPTGMGRAMPKILRRRHDLSARIKTHKQ